MGERRRPVPVEHRLTREEADAEIARIEGLAVQRAEYWHRRAGRAGDLIDYVQEAKAALAEAVSGFDRRRGTRFSTYALHRVRFRCRELARHEAAAGGNTGCGRAKRVVRERPTSFGYLNDRHPGVPGDERAAQHGEWVHDHRPAPPPEPGAVWAAVAETLEGVELEVVTLRFRGGLGAAAISRRLGLDHRRVYAHLKAGLARLGAERPDLEDFLGGNGG